MLLRTIPALLACAVALSALAEDPYAGKGKAFIASLEEDAVEAKSVARLKKALAAELAAEKRDPNADFIGEGLLVAYKDYRKAMKSWFRQYHAKAARQLMAVSAEADNDFLLAHANYFLARADLQAGRFEKSEKVLADLVAGELEYFHRDYEVVFYLGLAQGQLLKRDGATRTFARFLKDYPNAPERFRTLAKTISNELKVRGENELYDLADRMTLVQRFLDKQHAGKPTQKKQSEIIKILDRLIKAAEQQEQNSGGGGGGQGGGQGQGGGPAGGQGEANKPAESPSMPGGPSRPEHLAKRSAKNAGRAWGQLGEKDRKQITQFLNKNFPERYRHLLKQYYKELSDGDKK